MQLYSGYGIVLKALQKSTGHMVAIKQFRDNDSYVSSTIRYPITSAELRFLKQMAWGVFSAIGILMAVSDLFAKRSFCLSG